ncbi:MAG: hypothetical protein KDJ16_07625, partial [Hyphomicrobiales bacterium]|nr:hypothetical protein [Hyphomicrobiales bacterium]
SNRRESDRQATFEIAIPISFCLEKRQHDELIGMAIDRCFAIGRCGFRSTAEYGPDQGCATRKPFAAGLVPLPAGRIIQGAPIESASGYRPVRCHAAQVRGNGQ